MEKTFSFDHPSVQTLLDAFPSPVFVVDKLLIIHKANEAGRMLSQKSIGPGVDRLCGDFLCCVNSGELGDQCGKTERCDSCVVRKVILEVSEGNQVHREVTRMTVQNEGIPAEKWFLVSGKSFNGNSCDKIIVTLEDVTELVELRRIIPICSYCRKVRDDDDFWRNVEDYFARNTSILFTHGICPDCLDEQTATD